MNRRAPSTDPQIGRSDEGTASATMHSSVLPPRPETLHEAVEGVGSGEGYETLLDALEKDLQLDARTALIQGSIAGALGLARGTGSVTFSASATSNTVAIGLSNFPGTPTTIVITSAGTNGIMWSYSGVSRTGFSVTGSAPAAISATVNFSWIALL